MYKGVCIDKEKNEIKICEVTEEQVWDFMINNMYSYYEVKLFNPDNTLELHSVDGKPCADHYKPKKEVVECIPTETILDKILNACDSRVRTESYIDLIMDYLNGEDLEKPKLKIVNKND